MMTAQMRVGRLGEVRFAPPFAPGETDALAQSIRGLFTALGPRLIIFCCDLRPVQVFPPDVSDRLIEIMRSDNPKVERNGILIGESSVVGLQLERMVRDAGNPGRRVFRKLPQLLTWLGDVLTPAELQRVRDFLAEGAGV
jgi:hypothetical protein